MGESWKRLAEVRELGRKAVVWSMVRPTEYSFSNRLRISIQEVVSYSIILRGGIQINAAELAKVK